MRIENVYTVALTTMPPKHTIQIYVNINSVIFAFASLGVSKIYHCLHYLVSGVNQTPSIVHDLIDYRYLRVISVPTYCKHAWG